jgi:Flp pilus assembly pilin Flp
MGYLLSVPFYLGRDRRAVTALEYALIAAIIIATVVIGFTNLSSALSNQFNNVGSNL